MRRRGAFREWEGQASSFWHGEEHRKVVVATQWERASALVGDAVVYFDDDYRCSFDLLWAVAAHDPPRLAERPEIVDIRCEGL